MKYLALIVALGAGLVATADDASAYYYGCNMMNPKCQYVSDGGRSNAYRWSAQRQTMQGVILHGKNDRARRR